MAKRLQVLGSEVEVVMGTKGANKGVEFRIPKAQCVLHLEDGSQKVGVLNLPKDLPLPKPGFYTATTDVAADFSGKIVAVITGLIAVPVVPAKA